MAKQERNILAQSPDGQFMELHIGGAPLDLEDAKQNLAERKGTVRGVKWVFNTEGVIALAVTAADVLYRDYKSLPLDIVIGLGVAGAIYYCTERIKYLQGKIDQIRNHPESIHVLIPGTLSEGASTPADTK